MAGAPRTTWRLERLVGVPAHQDPSPRTADGNADAKALTAGAGAAHARPSAPHALPAAPP